MSLEQFIDINGEEIERNMCKGLMIGISDSRARERKHICLEVEESCWNVIRGKKRAY